MFNTPDERLRFRIYFYVNDGQGGAILNAKMRKIYEPAWARASASRATISRKTGSRTIMPFRYTDSPGNRRLSGSNAQKPPSMRATGTSSTSKKVVPSGNLSGSMVDSSGVDDADYDASPQRFLSPLARVFDGARQDATPAKQWVLWLASNKAKLGLKDDEIQWSGILDYLELRGKDKVTKAEIAMVGSLTDGDYISNNWKEQIGRSLQMSPSPVWSQCQLRRPRV